MLIAAIVNPKASNGRAGETWRKVRAHLPDTVQTLETKGPGHAIALTAHAIANGARTIVAVGGDGTINEVVNGFLEGGPAAASEASLAIVPHGTGSDFRRVLNLPWGKQQFARVILDGVPRLVDVLRVRYTQPDGTPGIRYSINVTSFGMGGAVAARAHRLSRFLGGRLGFLAATLRIAAGFAGVHARIVLDGSRTIEARITNVAAGNGQYHGSGMWVCPGASIEDGQMDVTIIEYLPLLRILFSLPTLYDGSIYQHPKVQSFRAKRVQATSQERALIEIDGEPLGKLPVEVEIVPKAIRLVTQ
jgi:YegS/Rv2252/BmrU family lipid kinase